MVERCVRFWFCLAEEMWKSTITKYKDNLRMILLGPARHCWLLLKVWLVEWKEDWMHIRQQPNVMQENQLLCRIWLVKHSPWYRTQAQLLWLQDQLLWKQDQETGRLYVCKHMTDCLIPYRRNAPIPFRLPQTDLVAIVSRTDFFPAIVLYHHNRCYLPSS